MSSIFCYMLQLNGKTTRTDCRQKTVICHLSLRNRKIAKNVNQNQEKTSVNDSYDR